MNVELSCLLVSSQIEEMHEKILIFTLALPILSQKKIGDLKATPSDQL
jgi:hypothetical protein